MKTSELSERQRQIKVKILWKGERWKWSVVYEDGSKYSGFLSYSLARAWADLKMYEVVP